MDKKRKRLLLKNHWKALIAVIIAGVIAFTGAIMVFVWFVQTSNIASLTISELSVASALWFIINLILWELLFVGLPSLIIFGLGGFLWWSGLSPKDKKDLKSKDKKSHSRSGGDAFEFLMFIAFIIYLLADGTFFTPFGDLPISYWLFSCLWSFIWLLILVGIPLGLVGLIYLARWCKKV